MDAARARSGLWIVMVDPDHDRRVMCAAGLEGLGLAVDQASDGASIRQFGHQPVTAILVWWEQAGAVLEALRCEPPMHTLPVVLLHDGALEAVDPRFCGACLASATPLEMLLALLAVLDCHATHASLRYRDASWVCPTKLAWG